MNGQFPDFTIGRLPPDGFTLSDTDQGCSNRCHDRNPLGGYVCFGGHDKNYGLHATGRIVAECDFRSDGDGIRGQFGSCGDHSPVYFVKQAVGDKKGIRRYGHAYVSLDEALSRVVIVLSGRPGLMMDVPYTRGAVGGFDVDLFEEFFHGFVNHSMVTLHIDNLKGKNTHHQIETVFKAFGRALRMAIEMDERMAGITPSTKGSL